MDKIFKAFAVAIVLFALVLAVFVGARVDQFTMSMLGGAFVGLMIAVPTTMMATMLFTRTRDPRISDRQWHHTSPLPPSPPQYWAMPQTPYTQPQPQPQQMNQVPPQLTNQNLRWDMPALPRRRFYVIGEAGQMEELTSPLEDDADFKVINPHTLGANSI